MLRNQGRCVCFENTRRRRAFHEAGDPSCLRRIVLLIALALGLSVPSRANPPAHPCAFGLTTTRHFHYDGRCLRRHSEQAHMASSGLGCENERDASGARAMAGYSIFIAHAPADARLAEDLTRLLAETGATVVYGADSSPTPEAQE